MKAPVEHRQSRGQTKADNLLRRAAAQDRARTCLSRLGDELQGLDADFCVEVLRAVLRAIASNLVQRAGVGRAVGILIGALNDIAPAWRSEAEKARDEAEAVFDRRAA